MANKPLSGLGTLLYESEAGSFATDPAGAGTYLPVIGGVDFGGVIQKAFDDETLRQKMVALPKLMSASGTLADLEFSFSFYLRGFSATVPAVAPTNHFVAQMIAAALGNLDASTDTPPLTLAGSTTSVVKCTDASLDDGNSTFAGGFFGFEEAGAYEGRFATDLDENEVTPSDELSILPLGDSNATVVLSVAPNGTTDLVHTGVTCYHIDTFDTTGAPSYTFTWQGHTQVDYIHLLGCRPTRMAITLSTGEMPRVEMTWRAVGFTSGDAGSALSAQAVSAPAPEVFCDAAACFLTDGTSRVAPLLIKSATYSYDIDLAMEWDPTATYGVAEMTKVGATVTAELDPLFDANGDQFETWYQGQTGLYHEASFGSQAGKLIGVRIPYGYIHAESYRGEREGLITKPLTLVAGDYETESGDDDVHTQVAGADVPPAATNPISKIFSVGFA